MTALKDAAPGARSHPADPRAWPWWAQVLGVYAASRALTTALFLWVARLQGPNPWTPPRPGYWQLVALPFDASWYRDVALHGYPLPLPTGPDGRVLQNAWAFFPLYPTATRGVMVLTRLPWEVAAPLLSTALAGAALLLVHRCVAEGAPRAVAAWPGLPLATVALVSVFPASPVLQVAYSESLALLLVAGALLALVRRRYGWAALALVALALTRPVVAPMAVVVVVHAAARWRATARGDDELRPRDGATLVGLVALAAASGFVWPAVAAWATGVPGAFVRTQEAWRGTASVAPFVGWTYVPQYWFGPWWPLVVAAGWAFAVAVLLAPSSWRLERELHAWSAAYVAYLLAAPEPGSSLARFLLLAFPAGAATAGAVGRTPRGRRVWLAFVVLLMVGLQAVWLRQVWVSSVEGNWPP